MRRLPRFVLAIFAAAAYAQDPSVPPCVTPARLEGQFDGAPGYFVGFKGSTLNRRAVAASLAKKYGFEYQAYSSWDDFIFVPSLSEATVATLRCEPDVDYISFNGTTHISTPQSKGR